MSKLIYTIYSISCKLLPYSRSLSYFFVFINRFIFSIYISPKAKIHPGTVFCYQGMGIVIGGEVEIGEKVEIGQGVTIGGRFTLAKSVDGNEQHWPKLGNNIFIGPNSVIIGPVNIGDNVIVGANSVVIKDCHSKSVYVGSPAKKVRTIGQRIVGDQYN